jgi:acetolactate synthase-1/2/3 large subunit
MGYGYPSAIGAKVACPDKEVIDIDGDGSFVMNIQNSPVRASKGSARRPWC